MSDIIFINFYKYEASYDSFLLSNGFSDTWDLCVSKGEMIWVDEKDCKVTFGSNTKTVYVSCYTSIQLDLVIKLTKQYPDIKFVVGGPAIINPYRYTLEFPSNLEMTIKSVEQYFGVPDYSIPWNLDVSDLKSVIKETPLIFTYSNSSYCYWGKCKFCNYHSNSGRQKQKFDLRRVEELDISNFKSVRFSSPCITKDDLSNLITNLNYRDDILYDLFIRCDKHIYESLEQILSSFTRELPMLMLKIGPEFPVDRILQFINKGFSFNDILNLGKIKQKYERIHCHASFITGWPNLIEEDIIELRKNVDTIIEEGIKGGKKLIDTVAVFNLTCVERTFLYDFYKNAQGQVVYNKKDNKDFYIGYFPKMSDEVTELNRQAKDIINEIPK